MLQFLASKNYINNTLIVLSLVFYCDFQVCV